MRFKTYSYRDGDRLDRPFPDPDADYKPMMESHISDRIESCAERIARAWRAEQKQTRGRSLNVLERTAKRDLEALLKSITFERHNPDDIARELKLEKRGARRAMQRAKKLLAQYGTKARDLLLDLKRNPC